MTHHLAPLDTLLAPPYKVVFMDCDGIIFDTNRSKCDAFRYALADYPTDAVEALVAHHMASGGISRYVKFKHFFATMHPVADPGAALAKALERFGAFSEEAYAALKPRPESLRFAAHFGGRDAVHVISGSDGDELRRVFDSQGLSDRFGSVCGSPETKVTHATRILEAAGATAANALFIGDGGGDWDAARAIGLPFIFLAEMSEWSAATRDISADCEAVGDGPGAAFAEDWAAIETAL